MASSGRMRRVAGLVGLLGALALPSGAQAAIPNIPDGAGGNITCTVQTGANAGQRHCSGIFTTFDGAPIDVNVGFPPAPASGPDGDFPIVGAFHGWGGSKLAVTSGGWINDGYAFFSMSDRGWGNSCGGLDPKRSQPVCDNGYNHLMDTRFEVRDAQYFLSLLADEGVTEPTKIGVTGGSYGGGISMALAALRDRVMLPDGTLTPWTSDDGKEMRIAAAAPDIPWTDLAYALMPNGRTLDYVADAPYGDRIGVEKQSFVAGLYATGQAQSNYAPPGSDPDADLSTWFGLINAGEPYDDNPATADLLDEVETHHSSYYIDHSEAPAPLLISNGWTDDLFPPDEAIRFYNRTRSQYPGAMVNLFFSDAGHQRGQNKVSDTPIRIARQDAWLDYFLKGEGPAPTPGQVETLATTCDGPADGPSPGPYFAPSWAQIAPGEVRYDSAGSQTIAPPAGDPGVGQAFDPITGPGACATASGSDQPGAASYRLEVPAGESFTLMGSPTILADINSTGPNSQLAARLLDVAPDGEETLVARGLYRPDVSSGSHATHQVFQLHPNGYAFAAGHTVKLELLPNDAPYGRVSNGQLPVTVSNLELRLPVLESADGGLIETPAAKVVPAGYTLAADFVAPPPGDGGGSGGGEPGSNASAGGGQVAGDQQVAPKRKKCTKKHARKRGKHCRKHKRH
jgi:predicted acyl esterase